MRVEEGTSGSAEVKFEFRDEDFQQLSNLLIYRVHF